MPTFSHEALDYNIKGRRLLDKDELKEAHSNIMRALEIDPEFEEAWLNLSVVFMKAGDLGKTMEVITTALEMFPDSSYVWGAWGSYLSAFSNSEEQIEEAFQKALQLDPTNAKAWGALALHLQDKNPEEADNAFRRALEIDPDNEKMRYFYASMLLHVDKWYDAEVNLRIVLEQAPEYSEAWELLGRTLYSMGKVREGIEAVEKSTEIDPENFDHYWILVMMQKTAGFLRHARETLRHMISKRPHFIKGWRELIEILGDMGLIEEMEEAKGFMNDIIESNPEFHEGEKGYLIPIEEEG